MRSVLYDIHRADAIMQVSNLTFGHDEEVAKYYQVVLEKHGISQAEFDSSLVWYTNHPQLFNKIYPKILTRCEEETNSWVTFEQELVSAETATPLRELTPLEDIFRTMQHGLDSRLLPIIEDTISDENEELLLPVGLCASMDSTLTISATQTTQSTPTAEPTVPSVPTKQDSIKEERTNRLRQRFGLQTSEPQ